MKLVELAYFTADVESMVAFYVALLNTPPEHQTADMAVFRMGEATIFIHRIYSPGPGELPAEDHTAFAVHDVDAACRTLESQGVTLEVTPNDYYWGRSAYLRSPDGHLIELTQDLSI